MNKYFFIGIKGAGMASLAVVLKDLGNEVIGSDVKEYVFTEAELKKYNIDVYEFDEFDITSDYIVIIGNSFGNDFSEFVKISEAGCQYYHYYDYVGMLSKKYNSIAVLGTHGKTSTTTLLKNLLNVNSKAMYLVGDGHGKGFNDADYFVFEACEYRNYFHHYYPDYAIITNIDHDHRDFFLTQEMYDSSFLYFAKNVTKNLIVCYENEKARSIFKDNNKVLFYGFESDCYFQATNIEMNSQGSVFDIVIANEHICTYQTKLFGEHNILNMLSCIAVAYLNDEDVIDLCQKYDGTLNASRRLEEYDLATQIVIDDYAHHPTELYACLNAVFQKYSDKNVVAIFEPHTIERLEEHYMLYAEQLNRCSMQVILPVVVPIRAKDKNSGNHIDSDIMLPYLKNGFLYSKSVIEDIKKMQGIVVIFIGPTITNYTIEYIENFVK